MGKLMFDAFAPIARVFGPRSLYQIMADSTSSNDGVERLMSEKIKESVYRGR